MRALTWIFCFALLPAAALADTTADTPADFSGEWVASGTGQWAGETPAPTNSQPSGGHSGMDSHGGHGGMGGGGHHGGTHSPVSTNGDAGTRTTTSGDPRLHAHALIIRQSDVVFDIAADGQRMAYRFDNRNNHGAPYAGTVTLTWLAPEMVIETHPDGGGSIQEHYSLTPDAKRLTLHIREQKAGEDTAREFTRLCSQRRRCLDRTSHAALRRRLDGRSSWGATVLTASCRQRTPCISLLISGATRISSPPDPTSAQKPHV